MATKKISELPLITALSGSQEETLIPVVVGGLNGTTDRITAENFSKFVNAYNATTSSNTFIGAQIINGNLTVTGNQVISGRLTVYEVVAQYETASILFSTGSTKLGDQLTDTHEFTGSTNITGSIIVDGNLLLNGASLNNSFVRIHQATGSLQNFTSSQADRNLDLSIVTGSLNQFTASQDDRNYVISEFTASQLIVNTGLASVTASLNNFSGSTNAFTGAIEQTTASIHLATASLNYFYQSTSSLNGFTSSQADRNLNLSIVTGSLNRFTASQDDRNFVISQFTSSTNAHIVGISDFTSSQLAVNLGNSIYTASVDSHIVGISDFTSSQLAVNLGNSIYTASVDSHIVGISTYTSSVRDTLARVHQATRSLELHSGSMIGVTNGLMAYTASNTTLNAGLRDEVNGIEAYTASLKGAISVSGTNVQIIGDLNVNKLNVQYISSSVLVTSGSNTFGDQATDKHEFTGSVYLQNALIIGTEVLGNAGLNSFTASTNNSIVGVSQFTSSQLAVNLQNSIVTSSFRIELNSIEEYTASLKAAAIVSSSTQIQNYDVFALNSNLYESTGSIKGEIAGIEAYTASLKGAAIVSSSQQVQNYFAFALTSSNNSFFGENTFTNKVTHTNGYIVLSQISASLNFVDDTAAAAGGVPLGGLYRNGNFIVIRIV